MRLFFILYMSFYAICSNAQNTTYLQCDLNDGTTITLSESQKRWYYQSDFEGKKIWSFNVQKKHHFVSARNIVIDEKEGTYKDGATLRFEHEKIHYILFKEFKKNGTQTQSEMGLLVLDPPRQKKFTCNTIKIDRFYEMLKFFPCDKKMKNKQKENLCSS